MEVIAMLLVHRFIVCFSTLKCKVHEGRGPGSHGRSSVKVLD